MLREGSGPYCILVRDKPLRQRGIEGMATPATGTLLRCM
jgi:hypothetical protein